MDNEFYFEDANPKKVGFTIFIIVIVLAILIFIGIFIKNRYTLNIRKSVTYEVGEKLDFDVSKYVTSKLGNKSDYKIVFSSMLTRGDVLDTVGEYEYKITYKKVTRTGKIKVVDTTGPKVEVEDIIIGVDEDFYPGSAVVSCDDYSLPCQIDLANSKDENISSKAGKYKVDIVVSDVVGNKTKKTINIEVKNSYNSLQDKMNDLKPHHIDPDMGGWKGESLIIFKEGIVDDITDSDEYDDILELISGDLHRYLDPMYQNNGFKEKELIRIYNKHNFVIGVTFYVKLDNNLSFYLSK